MRFIQTMLLEKAAARASTSRRTCSQQAGASTLEVVVPGRQACEVIGQSGRQTIGGRIDQQAAVDRRGPQLRRAHPRHPAGASSPARSRRISKTRR